MTRLALSDVPVSLCVREGKWCLSYAPKKPMSEEWSILILVSQHSPTEESFKVEVWTLGDDREYLSDGEIMDRLEHFSNHATGPHPESFPTDQEIWAFEKSQFISGSQFWDLTGCQIQPIVECMKRRWEALKCVVDIAVL